MPAGVQRQTTDRGLRVVSMTASTPWLGRELHFVGIAGAGMSGLALVAQSLGAKVTGSDQSVTNSYAVRLVQAGIKPFAQHAAGNVPPGAEVVVSTAIGPDNPERQIARARDQVELHRAELLGELTRLKPTIAVAGTHGKTTTSSMVVHALHACGLDPSYLIGGEVRTTGTNAAWGSGEWLVVEADESDRSLLRLSPHIAVLTNAEVDHHTVYGSQREVDETFAQFLGEAKTAVVWDRPELLALVPDGVEAVPFDAARPRLHGGGSSFEVDGLNVELVIPGAHNARNAAGALAACKAAALDLAAAARSLHDFSGAGRRFECIGTTPSGAPVVDDYAHHPTEVRATLDAARTLEPSRLIAIFQPHLFSRTQHEAVAFGEALALADVVVVCDVYPARERAEDYPGVSGRLVLDAIHGGVEASWAQTLDDAYAQVRKLVREGDLVLTLGAGDVNSVGRRLIGVPGASLSTEEAAGGG